jgi:Predicted rRNA methylase (SpoU class)
MNIVLLEPEIPANTGNIGRTCVATGTKLHLIEPLGFDIDEKAVKRSGLDYWEFLELYTYKSFEEFMEKNGHPKVYMATTKAKTVYSNVKYEADSYIMFGKESAGIPEEILIKHEESAVRIPMWGNMRSLNLSNAAAVILYEALRQNDFDNNGEHLKLEGELHKYNWEEAK